MGKRLFVGGLPSQIDDKQLNELFSEVGAVESASVIIDKFSGNSKGFGFVEMATEEDAQKAIEKLNNKKIGDKVIAVNEARPRPERRENSFGRGGYSDRNSDRRRPNQRGRQNRW